MNCRLFEEQVIELARSELMDAARRERAVGHAENCPACAQRLADEQALTAALRSLATASAHDGAPARVESMLLAALRQKPSVVAVPQTALRIPPAPRFRLRSAVGAGALAASIALLVLALARPNTEREPAAQERARMGPVTAPISSIIPEVPADKPDAPVEQANPKIVAANLRRETKKLIRNQSAPRVARQPIAAAAVGFVETMTVSGDGEVVAGTDSTSEDARQAETLSEFISLNGDGRTATLDGGQLVRMQVPRASLASLGLPVNAGRAGESVMAEVLLSDDGVARAIRLLH